MAFNIPNQGDALADAQSILFKEHIDILVAGVEGNGITSGCAVTPSAGMVIAVAAGAVTRVGVAATTSAATPTVGAAHATLHRFDVVVITATNTVAIRQGTAAAQPKPPALTAGDIALAMVFVPAAATSIAAANITDTRIDVPTDKQPLDATLTAIADGSLGAFSHRNKIINGGFAINQRQFANGASATAGTFIADRWKVTATSVISWTTVENKVTVTIPAGQTLKQVIEGLSLQSGTFVLSWEGTAQARIDAGSYGDSGITGTIVGGTNTTVEFGPGTVASVQLEFGTVVTPFEHRPRGVELALCQRYYIRLGGVSIYDILCQGYGAAGSNNSLTLAFPVELRSSPAVSKVGTWAVSNCSQPSLAAVSKNSVTLNIAVTALGGFQYNTVNTTTYLAVSAEL